MTYSKNLIEAMAILKAIDDELELPGDPPDEMKVTMLAIMESKDMDAFIEALRMTVRLTKRGIKDRVLDILTGQG